VTGLTLPALDGRTPLGFLAALGVLRLATEHCGHQARLAWSRQDCTAVLHDAQPDLDTLAADLVAVADSIPADGVLPGLPVDFPPLRGAPARMRFTRPALREFVEDAVGRGGETAERWLASLVTDLAVDAGGNGAVSLFAAPSGQQSMRSMLREPLKFVRSRPEVLHEALTAWRRYPGVSGEYLDHRVLFDAVDAADGRSAERGVPGATWLALMSYPLMLTTARGGQPATTSWQDHGRREGKRLVYPLWSAPLDVHAVRAVLSHDVLRDAPPGTPPAAARALSVFWIAHARRRKIPGRTFAGVLTPAPTPGRRGAPSASSPTPGRRGAPSTPGRVQR
jgi:hypothetical protein